MALAVHLKIILFMLCSSVFNSNPAGDATVVGSNVSIAAQPSTRERFYLNTDRPAPTNGTVTHLRYCYYGREDNNQNAYQALMALYRPNSGSNNYRRITDTVSVIKHTPLSQVSPADALLPGFNCDFVELEESVQVLQGDVIGACIYDTLIRSTIRRLDVISQSDNGYHMLYNSADDEDCENGVLPEVVGSNLEQTRTLRILHIFAEILSTDVEIGNDSDITVTVPSALQDPSTSEVIIAVIIGGLATAAIATMITIIIIVAACFLFYRKRRNSHSSYSYTINQTYNVRNRQIENEDENERDSSLQPPSTVPYYDYIEDGTPQPPRSRERVNNVCSSGYSDSMEPNRTYNNIMAHQVTSLRNAGDPSHSMVQNQAYRLH